jgi:hypothetical protein
MKTKNAVRRVFWGLIDCFHQYITHHFIHGPQNKVMFLLLTEEKYLKM